MKICVAGNMVFLVAESVDSSEIEASIAEGVYVLPDTPEDARQFLSLQKNVDQINDIVAGVFGLHGLSVHPFTKTESNQCH